MPASQGRAKKSTTATSATSTTSTTAATSASALASAKQPLATTTAATATAPVVAGATTVTTTTTNSSNSNNEPEAIEVYGARVHNLKNIDVKVPLHKMVAIAGVSGSGKSSLALGVLYAEGSRRYLEALSTYTRRRMSEAAKPEVDEVLYVPAALALRQRPSVPGIRSTFGTGTELLNSLRLMFSRLASHRCPNGHYLPPSINCAAMIETKCPECGAEVMPPSAEDLAFNSNGACRCCDGTGVVRAVDESSLVPDESLSIDEGAVAPWNSLMWSLMTQVCAAMGVRTDVPFSELTAKEREIVFHGPAEKKHILYRNKGQEQAVELDFTYYNAVYTVENALSKVKDEKGMKRVEKFLKISPCPECGGTRLSEAARAPLINGINLATACTYTLSELLTFVNAIPESLPDEMQTMARNIVASFNSNAKRLMELGLGYLTLDRASSTLSTGERQRMQLARAVRNRTTGVLYVLDEPSIGLHPANMIGLNGVIRDLLHDGNSVILVDHDTQVLAEADYLIEMGPDAGANGGRIINAGPLYEVIKSPESCIGPFLQQALAFKPLLSQQTASLAELDLTQMCAELEAATTVTATETETASKPKPKSKYKVKSKTVAEAGFGAGDATEASAAAATAAAATAAAATAAAATAADAAAADGWIVMHTKPVHTVKSLKVKIPEGKLTVVTGVSGSGKTTMVLESLIPALQAQIAGVSLPEHVSMISAPNIKQVKLIDASPIGINVRSTVATYANVLDELRKVYAKLPAAKEKGLKAGDFSYNTGKLRCPHCDGTGSIDLDVQFLPDIEIPCPTCHGRRYSKNAEQVRFVFNEGTAEERALSLPDLLTLDINSALKLCSPHKEFKIVTQRLKVLSQLGLGYLTLGEATPALSGGEAQRLKLAAEMGKMQGDSVFIFDEPTIGLHPLDVKSLLMVLDSLIDYKATVVVIEHDRDVIAHADHIIDMGPGGGSEGGYIVATGTPAEIKANPYSLTGKFLTLEE